MHMYKICDTFNQLTNCCTTYLNIKVKVVRQAITPCTVGAAIELTEFFVRFLGIPMVDPILERFAIGVLGT